MNGTQDLFRQAAKTPHLRKGKQVLLPTRPPFQRRSPPRGGRPEKAFLFIVPFLLRGGLFYGPLSSFEAGLVFGLNPSIS